MQTEYRMDYQNRYLVLSGENTAGTDTYPVRMLTENKIPGFLPCRTEELDRSVFFFYTVSGLLPLRSVLEGQELDRRLEERLLYALADGIETLERYLLPADYLLFSADCIYLDPGQKQIWLVCFPEQGEPLSARMKNVSEEWLSHLKHEDRDAVVTGYAFYQLCASGEATADSIRRLLQKGGGSGDPSPAHTPGPADDIERQSNEPEEEDDWLFPEEPAERGRPEVRRRRWKAGRETVIPAVLSALTAGYGAVLLAYSVKPEGLLPAAFSLLCSLGFLASAVRAAVQRADDLPDDNGPQPERELRDIQEAVYGKAGENHDGGHTERREVTMLLSAGGGDLRAGDGSCRAVLRSVGERGGEDLYLRKDGYILGKSREAADLMIPAPAVSRVHARLRWERDSYRLTDLYSKNGTCVGKERLAAGEGRLLRDGDEVRLADVRFRYEAMPQDR